MEKKVGFARLSKAERQEIGRRGGLSAAKKGRKGRKKPHRWTSEEAARAASRGHESSPGPRNPHGVTGKSKRERET